MNIAVLGAGKVGLYVVNALIHKKYNLTLIDKDSPKINSIEERLDVGTVLGEGTEWETLERAEVNNADLFLALTDDDEVNLISCLMAKQLGAKRTVCRTKKLLYTQEAKERYRKLFDLDLLVSTEVLTALEIAKHIDQPGSLSLQYFAGGEIEMRQFQLEGQETKILQHSLKELAFPENILVASIYRDKKLIIPKGEDQLQGGDIVTVIGGKEAIPKLQQLFRKKEPPPRSVAIAGGGNLGFTLAQVLEKRRLRVKLIEQTKQECESLSERLRWTSVIQGDATDTLLLEEENIASSDVFVACTGDDETNLFSALLAKDLGVKNTICVIHRPEYTSIVEKSGITLAISPRNVTANQLVTFLSHRQVKSVTVLGEGEAEVLELSATSFAPVVNKPLKNLNLPTGILLAAVIHNGEMIIPHGEEVIQPGDSIIVLCDSKLADKVQALIHPT